MAASKASLNHPMYDSTVGTGTMATRSARSARSALKPSSVRGLSVRTLSTARRPISLHALSSPQRTKPAIPSVHAPRPGAPLLRHGPGRPLSTETRAALDAAVASAPVVLFMKGTPDLPQCGFSRATVQALALNGLDPAQFAAYNVLDDADLRAGVKEYSDWPTIPQLYVGGEFVGGCDIVLQMSQKGELGKLLEEKGVLVEGAPEEAKGEAGGQKSA